MGGSDGLVAIEYFKWPDRDRHPYKGFPSMRLLGKDDHGTWLWSPPQPRQLAGYDSFMTLVPRHDWWTATWIFQGALREKIWVDIATPAVWRTPRQVTAIDLEIDVQLLPDGIVEVLDEDEFAQRAVEWRYPADIRAAAPDGARRVAKALRERDEPFFAVGDRWLQAARARDLVE